MDISFTGLQSEDEIWRNGIHIILGLLEDSLLRENKPQNKIKLVDMKKTTNTGILVDSTPSSPSNYNSKRKRSISESAQDRKLQKLSSNLANDIARSLSVSMEEMDTTSTPHSVSFSCNTHLDNPLPTLRRISMSGAHTSTSTLEQWLKTQAHNSNIPVMTYINIFQDKLKLLRKYLDLLQSSNQTYEIIGDRLSAVLRLADELSGDHTIPFKEIFPEWSLYESRIDKLAIYVQSIEDMITSINKVIPRSSDLLEDIKGLQQMLDNKIKLYGDSLAQNGLEWKAMGLPVDDQLIEAIKDWLYNLCVSLLDVLDAECKKAEAVVHDMADLIKIPLGEKLMASILAGLEFISDTVTFIGSTSFKVTHQCRILVAIYGHWVSENLDHLNNTVEKKQQTTKRMDIRFMQLMDNIGQAIDYLNNIGDQELILNSNEPNDNALSTAETLNSVLVELNIRAIGTIEISRQHSHNKIAGNIMANPETAFIYMSESLLGLADRILELTGIDSVEKKRLQILHAYLEELENALE